MHSEGGLSKPPQACAQRSKEGNPWPVPPLDLGPAVELDGLLDLVHGSVTGGRHSFC